MKFGRSVRLVTEKATESEFKIALENVESWTGNYVDVDSQDLAGDGIEFLRGDILFGKLRPYLAKAWRADRDGAAVGDFHIYRPVAYHSAYLFYLLLNGPYIELVNSSTYGSKMPRVSWGFIRNITQPLPPLDEQRQIAEYLDRETGKIDELIAKQEQLIATLTERRHSFIDELVAKQTRVEGDGLTRVKNLYTVIDQRTGNPDLPLLSVSIHYGVRIRGEMTEDLPQSNDLSQYKVVRPNDIVINRMRAFQGALGCSPVAGVVSPDYLVLRPKESVDPSWLALVFRSKGFVGEMTSRLRGIGSTESGMIRTPRINADDLGEIEIRVPALAEQIGLTHNITDDAKKNGAISNAASRMVELLRERRAALISAAVTGKIDLPSTRPEGALP